MAWGSSMQTLSQLGGLSLLLMFDLFRNLHRATETEMVCTEAFSQTELLKVWANTNWAILKLLHNFFIIAN